MKSGKNKWLTTVLEISLYIILVTGIVYTLAICNIIPYYLYGGAKILAMLHRFLGFVFIGLIIWHALTWGKWYKAWFGGKIKNKKSLLTKSISVLSLLFTFSLFFAHILPHKVFIIVHILTGSLWILLMKQHAGAKRKNK